MACTAQFGRRRTLGGRCSTVAARWTCAWVVVSVFATPALADELQLVVGTRLEGTVQGFDGTSFRFRARDGNDRTIRLVDVRGVLVDGIAGLPRAEQAFARRNWDEAITAYERVVAGGLTAERSWLLDYAYIRMLEAAARAGDPVQALRSAAGFARRRPDTFARLQAQTIDQLPKPAADSPAMTRTLSFIHQQVERGPDAEREFWLLAGRSYYTAANKPSPASWGRATPDEAAIEQIRQAVRDKQWDRAIRLAETQSAGLNDRQFAEAVFLQAEATAGGGNLPRAQVLYMWVWVNGKSWPGHASALLRVGELYEQQAKPALARRVYERLDRSRPTGELQTAVQRALVRVAATPGQR